MKIMLIKASHQLIFLPAAGTSIVLPPVERFQDIPELFTFKLPTLCKNEEQDNFNQLGPISNFQAGHV